MSPALPAAAGVRHAPAVSVVVPMFNAEKYIYQAVASLLGQTFRDVEVIVVDDGSTDRSRAVLEGFSDVRLRVFSEPRNRGQSAALNRGLAEAGGRYVGVMGADDLATPTKVETLVRYLEVHDQVGMVGSAYWYVDDGGRILGRQVVPVESSVIAWKLMFQNPIAASTILARRAVFEATGGFDVSLPYAEDMDLWGRVAAATDIAQLSAPLAYYRVHDSSISQSLPPSLAAQCRARVRAANILRLTGVDVPCRTVHELLCSDGWHGDRQQAEGIALMQQMLSAFLSRRRIRRRDRSQVLRAWRLDVASICGSARPRGLQAPRAMWVAAWRAAPWMLLDPRYEFGVARHVLRGGVSREGDGA